MSHVAEQHAIELLAAATETGEVQKVRITYEDNTVRYFRVGVSMGVNGKFDLTVIDEVCNEPI